MSNTPYMPLWVGDFLSDTQDLDAKEVGAYMLLLMSLWQRGGTLPNDQKKLKRVARVGRDWPRIWAALEPYFTLENDTISQDRLTKELQKADTKRRVNAHSGARGGRAKALKYKKAGLANATISPKQSYLYIPFTNVNGQQAVVSEGEKSEDKTTRDNPPADSLPKAPPDPAKALFDYGVYYLGQHGLSESRARSMIGKWRKDHTIDEVTAAMRKAVIEGTGDPTAYVTACLKTKTTAKGDGKPVPLYKRLAEKEEKRLAHERANR